MGIILTSMNILYHYKYHYEIDFSKIVTLGRQTLFMSRRDIEKSRFRFSEQDVEKILSCGGFADYFWEKIGAEEIASVDYSDFENATLIHDMNYVISKDWEEKFSVVYDGGTLEHVFNYPVAIMNAMKMVKVGGHIIIDTPANNYCGHGFYQFSPELFWSIFSERNGYQLLLIMYYTTHSSTRAFKLESPRTMGRRVMINKKHPTTISVLAKKVKSMESEHLYLQQSDYEKQWQMHEDGSGASYSILDSKCRKYSTINKWSKKVLPPFAHDKLIYIAKVFIDREQLEDIRL